MNREKFTHIGITKEDNITKIKKKPVRGFPIVSAAILFVVFVMCVFADLIATHDPAELNLMAFSLAPCREYIFGTDNLGRDVFSCLLYGGRISLITGLLSTAISTFIAMVYGTLSGLAPDFLDKILMRFAEILLSIPSLLTVIFVQAVIGEASVISISFVIGITSWFSMAKIIRTEVRRIRNSDFVLASKALGGSFFHILIKHLAPNFIPSIMFMVVMNIRSAIASESALSFMGLGLPLEVVSLGSMLSLAQNALMSRQWWIIVVPGVYLVMILMSVTEFGNYLRKSANRKDSML
ncbi:MAG: ABC transporter permease [Clostridia bacterium]|nr:ABC transporter permease [Clostridia bacterium]